MHKNYYLVLGIAQDASPGEIKEAYRRQAKAYHPDRYGSNPVPFMEIQEAYSVLSDPVRRQGYDRSLAPRRKTPAPRPEPMRRGRDPWMAPEPLVDDRPGFSSRETEIWLTQEQAALGGRVGVSLPGHPEMVLSCPPGVVDGQRVRLFLGNTTRCITVTFRISTTGFPGRKVFREFWP